MANGKIETYPEAARSIHVNLLEFCNKKSPYPEMIADAAREAKAEIEKLRRVTTTLRSYNNIRNDLDAYLYALCDYALGEIANEPKPGTYGLTPKEGTE